MNGAEERAALRIRAGRDELVELATKLIACDTTARDVGDAACDEERLQGLLARRLAAAGAEVELWEPDLHGVEHPLVPAGIDFEGRPQLVALVRGGARPGGGRRPQSLLLNGHIDAVTPGDSAAWASDPLRAEVRDGRLYGRGACDMKGGIAAMVYALECLRRERVKLGGDVMVCTNTDEESSGAGGYACVLHGVAADAGITAEPTGFNVWPGCRGTWNAAITIEGRAGHAEIPMPHWRDGGAVSAVEKLPLVLEALRLLREDWRLRPDHQHPLLAPGDVVVTMVHGGDWPVTYAPSCELCFDATYLPCHVDENGTGDLVGREIMECVNGLAQSDPWLREHPLRWRRLCDTVPAEIPAGHPTVQLALATARELGRPGDVAGFNSWHDAATFTRSGTPTFSFGPGGLEVAHRVDECVPVDDLVDCAVAIALIAMRHCGVSRD